ncbi:hypothetical protein SB48_HM08orf06255 [Heyndrickxia coagulans]|uniref:Uncharacterized protein n=1 Tax=Heyndrickxia coagulans TaxID=1398 RepID=A0AAN0T8C4_HEYCO|nr:hypothetical protein SB48_HM08orf06255 [Heyndrickxia coagulans]
MDVFQKWVFTLPLSSPAPTAKIFSGFLKKMIPVPCNN